ncbi:MAG: hypothetical protein HMLKMBBP_01313 [Planctomycetes bacterium]|nr:hypothetical protein [Planctomycetota bacterium]
MSTNNDRNVLIATIAVPILCCAGFGWLAWRDWNAAHAYEVTDDNPAAAEVTDEALWGERRRTQELKKQADQLRGEADLIAKREQDVIVFREVVQRDAQILPDRDQVNKLADTIDEFVRQSGVSLTSVRGLSNAPSGDGAISRMPFSLAVAGSFDQFLKFLNLFETMDRIVNVRGFTIQGGGQSQRGQGDGPPAHAIALELETFIYNGAAGITKPVEIQNYERRKEDPVIQKLIKQQRAARIEKYQLKPRINRRDPLIDPRRAQSVDDVEIAPEEEAKQRAIFDKMKVDIELLKADCDQLQQYLAEKKYMQVVILRQKIAETVSGMELSLRDADRRITVAHIREAYLEEIVAPFSKIKESEPERIGPPIIGRKEVAPFLEAVRGFSEARDFEASVRRAAEFESWAKDKQIVDDAHEMVTALRDLAREAQVMLDFERIPLKVTGRIRRPEGDIVIINGKTRKIGDWVDAPDNRCKLAGVRDDALVFDFDGFEITRAIDRK